MGYVRGFERLLELSVLVVRFAGSGDFFVRLDLCLIKILVVV